MKKISLFSLFFICFLMTGCQKNNFVSENSDSYVSFDDSAIFSEDSQTDDEYSDEIESTPIASIEDYVPVVLSELDIELDLIEIESTFLADRFEQDLTTVEMDQVASKLYTLWDDELNSLWSRFWYAADKELQTKVLDEQREWIVQKEAAATQAGKMYEGGTLQKIVETKKKAYITRLRCYDIATYLGELTNQSVRRPILDIDGFYADTQGTAEAYSDLTIQKASDGFYEIEISIYRLTTLSGIATLENGTLKFIDETMHKNIKGDIIVEDESATFIITESDWENLNVGDSYYFDEKWD